MSVCNNAKCETEYEMVLRSLVGNGRIQCNLLELTYQGNDNIKEFYSGSLNRVSNTATYYLHLAYMGVIVQVAHETIKHNDPDAWTIVNENVRDLFQAVFD